jgi:hypothetical protein
MCTLRYSYVSLHNTIDNIETGLWTIQKRNDDQHRYIVSEQVKIIVSIGRYLQLLPGNIKDGRGLCM